VLVVAVLKVVPALQVSLAVKAADRRAETGDPAGAVAVLERVLGVERFVLDPVREVLWLKLSWASGQAAAQGGLGPAERQVHLERARQAALRALALAPENANSHAWLGQLKGEAGPSASAEALQAYDRALALDPRNVIILGGASRTALKVGDVASARRTPCVRWS